MARLSKSLLRPFQGVQHHLQLKSGVCASHTLQSVTNPKNKNLTPAKEMALSTLVAFGIDYL